MRDGTFGIFMLVLSLISIVTGIWDIWIYKRNLPLVAKQSELSGKGVSFEVNNATRVSSSVTEQTTRKLNGVDGSRAHDRFQNQNTENGDRSTI
jgi:hypothetical protein